MRVSKDVPLEKLAPLGCGVQTGAGGVMNSLKVRPGTSIAVFGTGSVGLSAIMAAKVVGGTTIIAVDVNSERLNTAKELGRHAPRQFEPDKSRRGDPEDYRQRGALLPGMPGIPDVLSQSLDCLALTGVAGLIGVAPFGSRVSLDCQNILNGRTVRGIVEGDSIPDIFIPQLIEPLYTGAIPFRQNVEVLSFGPDQRGCRRFGKGKGGEGGCPSLRA